MLRKESNRVTNVWNSLTEGTGGKCWPKSIRKWAASVRLQISVLHTDTGSGWQLVSMGMQVNNSEPATRAHWSWTKELIHGRGGIKTLPVLSEGGYRLARGWGQDYPHGAGLEPETSVNTCTLTQIQMQPVEIVIGKCVCWLIYLRSPLAVPAENGWKQHLQWAHLVPRAWFLTPFSNKRSQHSWKKWLILGPGQEIGQMSHKYLVGSREVLNKNGQTNKNKMPECGEGMSQDTGANWKSSQWPKPIRAIII